MDVGSRVVFRSREQEREGRLLEIRGEHGRCELDDGRTVWIRLAELTAVAETDPAGTVTGSRNAAYSTIHASVPPAPAARGAADYFAPPSAAAEVPWSPPVTTPDRPLGPGLIALIYLGLTVFPLGCTLIGAIAFSIPYYLWRRTEPKRAAQWQRHVWIAFASGIFIWTGFGMILAAVAPRQERGDAQDTNLEITFRAGGCTIQTPAGWRKLAGAENALIQLADPREKQFVGIARTLATDLDPDASLAKLAELSRGEEFTRVRVIESGAVDVNGGVGHRELADGYARGLHLLVMRDVFESGPYVYVVTTGALQSDFASLRPKAEAILGSVSCP
jgi:hypothetical protein